MESTARRLSRLVDPIHEVAYRAAEPTAALMALGHRNYWDGYFAGRAAPLGRVPAEVVHAVFYNFAAGEVSRHIPRVWDTATPESSAKPIAIAIKPAPLKPAKAKKKKKSKPKKT